MTAPPVVFETLASPGRPLPQPIRAEMEERFGQDFGPVRLHTDTGAAQAACAVNARAYTSGNHVVFADGEFSPGSASGERLLAHELAHVVQQRTGSVRPGMSRPGDASEQEAESLANSAAHAASFGSATGEGHRSDPEMAVVDGGRAPDTPSTLSAAGQVVQRWPGDGMVPPGDCSWANYLLLRAAVEAAKAVVNTLGACTPQDTCAVLVGKIAAIATEIAARVALDSTCFKGGDTGHRQQVQDKIGMLNRCYRFFAGMNCLEVLAAEAAAAAAAAQQAAAADAATAADVEQSATATEELIEGAATAGETVEEGVTLVEVLEGIGLVLAL